MWASELADEAPGIRLTLCKGCRQPSLSEDHCKPPPAILYRPLHGRMLPVDPMKAIITILVAEGGRAHYKRVATRLGLDNTYAINALAKFHRDQSTGIVRVDRGTYAYLPPELRRDQPS